jgi:hypothetical protein
MSAAKAAKATSAQNTTGPVTTTAPAAPPTIHAMIVFVPDGMSPETLLSGFPHHHLGTEAAPSSHLWAMPKLRSWHVRQLTGVRRGGKGEPTRCAGGPIGRLNLAGMRDAAVFHAGLRYQQWLQAVAGTRAAKAWREFEALHLADPSKMSWDEAKRQFLNQARVNAMRIYNEANYASPALDPYEVEQF